MGSPLALSLSYVVYTSFATRLIENGGIICASFIDLLPLLLLFRTPPSMAPAARGAFDIALYTTEGGGWISLNILYSGHKNEKCVRERGTLYLPLGVIYMPTYYACFEVINYC